MIIDKDKLIKGLQNHIERYERNAGRYRTELEAKYDEGYVQGLDVAIRMIKLQPKTEIGQVAFDFDCAWMKVGEPEGGRRL